MRVFCAFRGFSGLIANFTSINLKGKTHERWHEAVVLLRAMTKENDQKLFDS